MTSKAPKKPGAAAAKAADAVIDAGCKVLEDAVETGTKTATNFFEQANNMNSENMQKTAEVMKKSRNLTRKACRLSIVWPAHWRKAQKATVRG